MKKIEEFIKKNGIAPRDCEYHTMRSVANKKGEYSGKVRVLVLKGSNTAMVEYRCPECGHEGYLEKPWKRPFAFACERCSFLIRVPRLRSEVKKKK